MSPDPTEVFSRFALADSLKNLISVKNHFIRRNISRHNKKNAQRKNASEKKCIKEKMHQKERIRPGLSLDAAKTTDAKYPAV
jgi:hypothetical protein